MSFEKSRSDQAPCILILILWSLITGIASEHRTNGFYALAFTIDGIHRTITASCQPTWVAHCVPQASRWITGVEDVVGRLGPRDCESRIYLHRKNRVGRSIGNLPEPNAFSVTRVKSSVTNGTLVQRVPGRRLLQRPTTCVYLWHLLKQLNVVRAVPRFIQMKTIVQIAFLQKRQKMDSPTEPSSFRIQLFPNDRKEAESSRGLIRS